MLRLIVGLAGFVAVLTAAGLGGLAWRLTRGPVDVTAIARIALDHFAPTASLDRMTLAIVDRDLSIEIAGLQSGDATLVAATTSFELRPMLHGALRPRIVTLSGLGMQATRRADGKLSVRGIPGTYQPTEPDRPPGLPDHSGDSTYPVILGGLTHILIHDADVTFTDAASGQSGAVRDLEADLRRDVAGALTGHVQGKVCAGETAAAMSIDAVRMAGEGPIAIHAAIGAVNPAVLARLDPALARLGSLDAPVSLSGDAILSPGFDLKHATLHADSPGGRVWLPKKGGGTAAANFAAMTLDLDGNEHGFTLQGLRVVLAPSKSPTTTVLVTGEGSRTAQRATARLHATLDRGQIADLPALWPAGVGGNARPWLVENLVAGSVHDGAFDLALKSGPGLDDITVASATGAMQAEAVTLYWLRPIQPIEFPHALLTLTDADTLVLTAPAARLGAMTAKQVGMRIVGMSVKDQVSQIDADITAPIADAFTLLHAPRLKLLSVHPIPINDPTGQSSTHLSVYLPLESKLTMDMVGIHATSSLTNVRIPKLVAGRPMEAGAFALDVTMQGLTLDGNARVAGIPSAIGIAMDFRDGRPNQIVEHGTVSLTADAKALTTAGLDTAGLVAGSVTATLDYAEQRGGRAILQMNADMGDASLTTPLGWSKAAGLPATAAARVDYDHGQLVGIQGIRADGPGLSLRASSDVAAGAVSVLHVDQGVIGKTSLTGSIAIPAGAGDPVRIVLAGPELDLTGFLNGKTAAKPDAGPPGRSYRVDLRFDRVLVSDQGEGVGPVTLIANGDRRRIVSARLTSTGPEHLDAAIAPQGDRRRVKVSVGDLGVLLRRAGAGMQVDNGVMTVTGDFDDAHAGSPLAATITVSQFAVRRASIAGKMLQGMTLYGMVDVLRGPGLAFDEMTMPITLTGSMLDIHGSHASSASLGVTTDGRVDLAHDTLNLTGTIVPAYLFNTLPGRVPLIGRLLSPEAGGGLFAATYAIRGPFADPVISINPLAALTPGALRGLFDLFD